MADIISYLNKIKTALYGKEVRSSLAEGLQVLNQETEAATQLSSETKGRQDNLEKRWDLVVSETTTGAEIIESRVDLNGEIHPTIKKRIDSDYKKVKEAIEDLSISVKKFGAIGNHAIADDTKAIQDTINHATKLAKMHHTRIMVYFPNGSYRVSSTIVVDASYVSLFSHGARIYYAKNTDALFWITNHQDRAYKQNFRVLDGFYLEGYERGTATALYFAGNRNEEGGVGKGPSHVKLYSLNISNFYKAIDFGDNAYLIGFNDSDIYDCNLCINIPAGTENSGERITFRDCNFFDSSLVLKMDGWFDVHFNGCSFDYCETFVDQNRGNVFVNHSSLETNQIYDAMFKIHKSSNETPGFEAVYPTLSIKNTILTFWPIQGYPYPIIHNGQNTTVIFKDNVLPFAHKYSSRFLMDGQGHVICNGNNYNAGPFLISNRLNVFGWGDIKSTTDLIVLGENPPIADKPVLDLNKYYTNNASLKFSVSKNGNIAAMNIPKFRTVLETGKCFGISAMVNKDNYPGDIILKILMKTSAQETVLVTERKIQGSFSGWRSLTLPIVAIQPNVEYIDLIVQSETMTVDQSFNIDDIQVNII